jgi:hypothetical protein
MHTKAQIQTGKEKSKLLLLSKKRAITTASGAPPFNHVPMVLLNQLK